MSRVVVIDTPAVGVLEGQGVCVGSGVHVGGGEVAVGGGEPTVGRAIVGTAVGSELQPTMNKSRNSKSKRFLITRILSSFTIWRSP
jgi:hypothetical protein